MIIQVDQSREEYLNIIELIVAKRLLWKNRDFVSESIVINVTMS
jgi:hypothetical protein